MSGVAVFATVAISVAGFIYSGYRTLTMQRSYPLEVFVVAVVSAVFLCLSRHIISRYILERIGNFVISRKATKREAKIKKFAACTFKASFFIGISVLEYKLLSEQDFTPTWLFGAGETANCWTQNYTMPDQLIFLFMASLGYHLHSTIYHCCLVERRADFGEMLLHHGLTLWLMVLSYVEGFSRIGLLIVFLNDVPDIFVYLTKSLGDTIFVMTSIVSYGFLVAAYFYFRLLVFPVSILPSLLFESNMNALALFLYTGFLVSLFLLHAYWFSLLVRIGINLATTGSRCDLVVDRNK